MTLKRYLFLLIAALVILTTLMQLGLIYWSAQHLDQEISQKSRILSRQLVEVAVDNLHVDDSEVESEPVVSQSDDRIRQLLRDNDWKYADDENLQLIITDNKYIKVLKLDDTGSAIGAIVLPNPQEITHVDIDKLRSRLRQTLGDVNYQWQMQGEQHQVFVSANGTERHSFSFETGHDSALQQIFYIVASVVLATGVIALILGYVLSHYFSRPLAHLSHGFSELEDGRLGFQVKESGVEEIKRTLGHFNHMSQRLDALSQTEKKYAEQKHLAELGEVSLGLAHALRNPIHTIGLTADMLQEDDLSPSQRQSFINKIQSKITHINKTIQALLTLTTAGVDRSQEVDLNQVLSDIVLEAKTTANQDQRFKLNVPPNATLRGAESELRAIMHSVVINACEAGAADGDIQIVVTDATESVTIKVIDQGQGLDQHIAQQLFQPHVTSKAEGSGMGLYIARRLSRLYYGGDITLTNNDDKGVTATITLRKDFQL